MRFETRKASSVPDVMAPDGSEVRILGSVSHGGMALFTLPPGAVSKAVAHRTIEEVWYFISGRGRMWRQLEAQQEITEVGAGMSITIPTGTRFQFRCVGSEPLVIVGATMPPWPGPDEAYFVEGPWPPTV
jgi:mannose-6-phosphate isomerase-like protein (cupin superfamily)